jgi:SNF2 family DNA or RNA helicase
MGAAVSSAVTWTPHEYQLNGVRFLHGRTSCSPTGKGGGGLLLDPGLGKTTIVLEWVRQMQMFGLANRFLVVAPLRVVYNVWPDEIRKWSNFSGLTYAIIHGPPQLRKKRLTLPVNFHVINREGLPWLVKLFRGRSRLPWQGIIIDESHGFKQWSAARTKAARELVPLIPYRVIMTGTPAPRNLEDLFAQVWLLDEGEALGENITAFRNNYCYAEGERKFNSWRIKEGLKGAIQEAIKPVCLRLDAKDYLQMPPISYHDVFVDLPADVQTQYDDMEREMFLALSSGDSREVLTAGAKYNVCRQIANGGVYCDRKKAHNLHTAKTDAVLELLEELGGKPALIAYQFQHDLARLKAAIPGLHAIQGGMKEAEVTALIKRWNEDSLTVPYLAVQPQALAEGVNMQAGSGRDVIWAGPTDNLATYIQFNTRIYRQGVGSPVRVHRIWTRNTVDDLVWRRTDQKFDVQSDLLEELRRYAQQKMGASV